MIKLKSDKELAILRAGGKRLATILQVVTERVISGITTGELDDLATELILTGGDQPAFKGYRPEGSRLAYPAALCVSVNEEIVHGIPSRRVLEEGDIVGLDLGLSHEGLFTDMAVTVPVGKISEEAEKLMTATKKSLALGIKEAKAGNHLGDIGFAIISHIKANGFQVVEELSGHGVGFLPHEDPYVMNWGIKGEGEELKPGLVIAIEPMATTGSGKIKLRDDGFTFITRDGKISAHFEHTIVITEKGSEILTLLNKNESF
ncbi:MAG: type I methionyl aminopeptidase [Patescibacteria group bacterium]